MSSMIVDGKALEAITADSVELWRKMDTVANDDPTEKMLAESATATLSRADELSDKLNDLLEAGDGIDGRPRWADELQLFVVRRTLTDVASTMNDPIIIADIRLAIELIDVVAMLPDE